MSQLEHKLAEKKTQISSTPAVLPAGLSSLLALPKIRGRFEEVLGARSAGFLSSVLSVVNGNELLKSADPMSIIGAAAVAATLDLPINPNLGFAAIVPYRENGKPVAQFQMMARGYVQLAIRSGQYATMNVAEVLEGEIAYRNRITGDITWREPEKPSTKEVGYVAYFRLLNGFEKFLFMTVDEIHAHGRKYSKSYNNPKGQWQTEFSRMAQKTVLKQLLSHWGILSIDMQKAIAADQAVVRSADAGVEDYAYPDNPGRDDTPKPVVVNTTAIENPSEEPETGQAPAAVLTPPSAEPANPPAASVASPSAGDNTPSEQFLALTGAGYPREAAEKIVGLIGKNVPLAKWSPFQREAFALVVSAVVNSLQRGMEMDEIQDALHSCIKSPKSWNKGAVEELRRALGAVFVLVEGGAADEPTDADLPV